jgi:hypothetical protein
MLNILKSISQKAKDVSFANLFCRKIVVRLLVFVIISFIAINYAQLFMKDQTNKDVDNRVSDLAILLSQTVDSTITKDRLETTVNNMLSNAQDDISNTLLVDDATLLFYNLSEKSVIARSSSVSTINSKEVIDWWYLQTGETDGLPKISLSDEIADFCERHNDSVIYIKEIFYLNSVLFPSSIFAKGPDGTIVEECTMQIPSTAKKYVCNDEDVELKIVGNTTSEKIFELSNDTDFQATQEETIVIYPNITAVHNVNIITKTFKINKCVYQIDCLYQVNFWDAFLMNILLFEAIGILVCIAAAFINAKETIYLYH